MALSPQLRPLIGTWRGPGSGHYPTIDPFNYSEELIFRDVAKPFLVYQQRTWSPDGRPLHMETGFLRSPTPSTVELVLAQPTGHAELAEGTLTAAENGLVLELQSPQVLVAASAKPVAATARTYRLVKNQLSVDFSMAAVGAAMTHHLHSDLIRAED
ncbi:FABP family protein [Brevibacterium aurantiacum]|uniref:FABP family protein n=1 Tax=Brevibacterium aurantiacum TaxID=273384 RepID=A0A556CHT6_BREAU|nr:FABP family protein [Brevibacterium aurantiacum]TSI16987.1 FABP family protein [Brevibacterium aurantiacum]